MQLQRAEQRETEIVQELESQRERVKQLRRQVDEMNVCADVAKYGDRHLYWDNRNAEDQMLPCEKADEQSTNIFNMTVSESQDLGFIEALPDYFWGGAGMEAFLPDTKSSGGWALYGSSAQGSRMASSS